MKQQVRKTDERLRLWICYGITGSLLTLLIIGIGYRQLIQGAAFQREESYQHKRLILEPGARGLIYDRQGRLLVGNQPQFSAVIYLNELRPEFRARYRDLRDASLALGQTFDSLALERLARAAAVQAWQQWLHRIIGRFDPVKSGVEDELG